jgi:predicted GNAT family N-acyltransferase
MRIKHVGENQICNLTEKITIKIVENEEERLKAMLVRAIVYMHEQQCPYNEEFDLNDYTATQIVGMVSGEPVLTARIRYFSSYAKLERIAIRTEYRGRGYAHQLLQFLLSLCKQKGFSRFYLHAQERLRSFYARYGFKVIGEKFGFSDHAYVEMVLEEATKQIGIEQKIGRFPMLLNRPENNMKSAGPLERDNIFAVQQDALIA